MGVNSAIAVEKEIAADTIGSPFAVTQMHFLPFVKTCTLELISSAPLQRGHQEERDGFVVGDC